MARTPPVMIGGTGRSGTTLLVRLLTAHQDLVALTWETQFIVARGGLIECARSGFEVATTEAFVERLRTRWFRRTVRPGSPNSYEAGLCADLSNEELESALAFLMDNASAVEGLRSSYELAGTFVQRLFAPLVERSGATTWVEKTPRNVLYQQELQRMFPGVRFIHVVRDGRDVAVSMRDRSMWPVAAAPEFPSTADFRGDVTLGKAARYWAEILRLARVEAARVPQSLYHEVHLEDLVAHPIAEATLLADFLGVNRDGLPLGMLDTSRVGTFRKKLTSEELALLEEAIGRELEAEGYGRDPGRRFGDAAATGEDSLTARRSRQRDKQVGLLVRAVAPGAGQPDPEGAKRGWQQRGAAERPHALLITPDSDMPDGEGRHVERQFRSPREPVAAEESQLAELERERDELVRERSLWSRDLARMRVRALRAERRARRAEDRLARMKARRWWRLGAAVGALVRRPYDLRRLVAVLRVLFVPAALPSARPLDELDAQIEEARADAVSGPPELKAARVAFEAGRYEDALRLIDASPPSVRAQPAALMLQRDCYVRMGELTKTLGVVRRALAEKEDPVLEQQARLVEGRLREMRTTWLPDVGRRRRDTEARVRRRVLHIVKESLPYFQRGYTMRSHSTFLAQAKAGWEPIVVTSLGFPRHQGFTGFSRSEVIDGIVHHRLDPGPQYDPRRVPLDLQLDDHATMLAAIADEVRPSLVQAGSGYRGYETALVGLAIARRDNVPFIYEFRSFLDHTWTWEIERSERGEQYEGRRRQELRCLREADHVITIAQAMRDNLVELGVDGDKIAVVPNVVDVDRFAPREPDETLEEQYGLSGRAVVGYISNLGQREGIDHLLRAVSYLRASGLDVAGFVVGDGPEREALEALVQELGLEGHVVLTGHVPNEQIEAHYSLIDVFVVPRIDDKAARLVTPLKPLEAMAMGLPVVAADLPALHEQVEPGTRGEVFRPGDSRHLAEVLRDLLEDESRRVAYGQAGRDWVVAERTLASNVQRYARVLEYVERGAR